MELNIKSKLLNAIGQIFEQSKDCGLKEHCIEKLKPHEDILGEYLQVSPVQAFFFANIFGLNHNGNRSYLESLSDFFSCNPMRLLEFSNEIDALVKKELIKKELSQFQKIGTTNKKRLVVNEKVVSAILNNHRLPQLNPPINNAIDLLEKFYELGLKNLNDEINRSHFIMHVKDYMSDYAHFGLVQRVNKFNLSIDNSFLFFYLIWKTLTGNETTDIETALEGIYQSPSTRITEMQHIINGENELVKQNLVEIEGATFFNDTSFKLTEYATILLQKEGLNILTHQQKKDIINPESIPYKEMFYNRKEQEQIELIQSLLDKNQLSNVQKKLKEKKLRQGFTILLHGQPGTGKTETVYQIAKATQRDILRLDLAGYRSKFFGESEKNIRSVFSKYRRYTHFTERTPILLLNEADGIISKRREISSSLASQTENIIQNILLEEMENFEGILFATSNLIRSFDNAFERRFLFKVELQKPDLPVRARIWEAKLRKLTYPECEQVAKTFNFSGGQIDNITSKCIMHEIIHNTQCSLKAVIEYCREETMDDIKREKIGFNNN